MKLANVEYEGRVRVAAVIDQEVVDLSETGAGTLRDVSELLAMGEQREEHIKRCVKQGKSRIPLSSVKLLAPVRFPDKILGVGMNYHTFVAAVREAGVPLARTLTWFLRPRGCICGPSDDVWLPRDANDLDYEAELAVIIGRSCRHLSAKEARTVVAGYTVANDLTLRERVLKSVPLGKCFDTHTPLGPWIVTDDEIGDPHQLGLKTWVNGILRQDGNTSDMIHRCEELIAEISQVTTLHPGDILLTGTPTGSGIFSKPPLSLGPNDLVKVEIEGIGSIENRVIAETPEIVPYREARRLD